MRDFRYPVVCLLACLAMVPMAHTAAQSPQPPQFRAGVDLVHLDVSVLDRNRRPVLGLTTADFTILEDGKPQAVSTFAAVEYPDAVPPTTAWMRDVPPDTRRNDVLEERRLFVLVVDDATAEVDMHALKTTKTAARDFINRLGPSDLAAVLFTTHNQHAQDFTSDRARLLAAVETFNGGFRGMSDRPETDEWYFRSSVDVLRRITEALVAIPERRKTIVYIGQGVPVDQVAAATPTLITPGILGSTQPGAMSALLIDRMQMMFALASRANVNVYTIDTCGLRVPAMRTQPPPTCKPGLEQEYLRDLAHATGGRAAIDMNDVGPAVEQIFIENGSYYLLGFNSTNPRKEGRTRRLEVKVNRPDVEVRTRTSYTEVDTRREHQAQRAAAEDPASPLAKAVSGLLPKGDGPMQAWAAAYAGPGLRTANVALTLAIRQTLGERPTAITETVDLTVDAFTPEGRRRAGKSATVDVALRPGPAGVVGYEIVSSLSLAPGRYQLRIGARLRSDDSTGSIYYDLDVPDFSRNSVALSGIGLSAMPGVTSTTAESMAWLPGRPTTARLFEQSDRVTAFVRVYKELQTQRQGMPQRRSLTTSVPVRTRVVDAHGATVWATTNTIDGAQLAQGDVDVSVAIPVDTLKPGAYLLSLEARGSTQAVRFTVR